MGKVRKPKSLTMERIDLARAAARFENSERANSQVRWTRVCQKKFNSASRQTSSRVR